MSGDKKFLFICGCPRSGTTALWRLLSSDKAIRLGVERYGNRFFSRDFISPALFEKERFFSLQAGDTFYSDLEKFNKYYLTAANEYDQAVYFGDKIPKLYEYFDRLFENFLSPKVIFIFRNIFDVAASYKARLLDPADDWRHDVNAAIKDWNLALRKADQHADQIFFVEYEALFTEGRGLEKIFSFLKLADASGMTVQLRNLLERSKQLEQTRSRALSVQEVQWICERASFGIYRRLLQRARE